MNLQQVVLEAMIMVLYVDTCHIELCALMEQCDLGELFTYLPTFLGEKSMSPPFHCLGWQECNKVVHKVWSCIEKSDSFMEVV